MDSPIKCTDEELKEIEQQTNFEVEWEEKD